MYRLLVICAAVAALAAGCASTPETPKTTAKASTESVPPNCIRSASRIPRSDCDGPGRVHTDEDIQRTGQNDPGSALQMLDPAVQVHH